MKRIPNTSDPDNSLVVRTDLSDEAAWQSVCDAVVRPVGDFRAYVEFLSDPGFSGLSVDQLIQCVSDDSELCYLFVADHLALADREHPILVVDLCDEPGRSFRVIPSEMWSVENNLSTGNMDFCEFASAVDPNRVFREFPES